MRCRWKTPPSPEGIRFIEEPPPAASAAVPPRRRRGWPIGTLAFLTVIGLGVYGHHRSAGPFGGQQELTDQLERQFQVEPEPKVEIEGYNGEVTVEAGEDDQVSCTIERRATAADEESARMVLTALVPTLTQDGNTVTIRVEKADWFQQGWHAWATIRVRVPADSTLRLGTSNGPVIVRGIEGPIQVTTSNAPIEVRDGRGALALETSNGPIICEARDALLDLKSSNGPIEFIGTVAEGASKVLTSNAGVCLILDRDQEFRIEAKTSNGEIDSDFSLKGETGRRRSRLVGATSDEASALIQVETTNGEIELEESD